MKNHHPIVITTTAPNQTEAEQIGALLLQNQLAACVQYEPIRSQYVWQGRICCDEEVRLTIKTTYGCYRAVEKMIVRHHSYECPQVLMWPVSRGFKPYLKWLEQLCKGAKDES